MSRRGDPVVYDPPPRNRWDRERFDTYRSSSRPGERERDREIDIRISEQRRPSPPSSHHSPAPPPMQMQPAPPPMPRRAPTALEERERYWERDRFSPPAPERRRDVNVYWEEPTPSEIASRALAPYRRKDFYEAPPMPSMAMRPARPQYIRRQSSWDAFDRQPLRYADEWRPPAYVPVPLPPRREERRGREYDDWEEVRYRDRDLSPGWEEEYRDVRVRRRGASRHRRRSASVSSSATSSSSDVKSLKSAKSAKSGKSSKTVITEKTVVKEEKKVELLGKKGKTRMPKRLVHKQVISDMGLPFEEEEHFIIVQRALEKDHIDDIIKKSESFKTDCESPASLFSTLLKIYHSLSTLARDLVMEAPTDSVPAKVTYKYTEEIKEGGVKEEIKEEIKEEKAELVAPPPPPPPPPAPIIDEKIIRKEVITESAPAHTALAALQLHDHGRRSDRDIRDEIRALEAEREALRLERRADRKLLEAERFREDRDYEWELVERRESRPAVREEVVRVEKDRRGKLALVKSSH